MSFRIEGHGVRLQVRIENDSHEAQEVVEAVHACRALSWWSCPSGECARVGECEARTEGDVTVLTMTSRTGEPLSPSGVAECLRYVLGDTATGAAH